MAPRFHAPDAHSPGERVALSTEESHHLTRVLRLRPGDTVRVFDGRGAAFEATVVERDRGQVVVRLDAPCDAAPEPRVRITLAVAVLKGDRLDDVVRDAVMLGVSAIQPVVTARTEVRLAALERSRRVERWTRVAVSSVKQCGRAVVPAVHEPCAFETLMQHLAAGVLPKPHVLLVEPSASGDPRPLSAVAAPRPAAATLLIGPEGGWTPAELEQAAATCELVTLGGRTLRADAAPLVALSALFALWDEL